MAPLRGSVGQGGTNQYEDVRAVQGALNRFPESAGGPVPKLDTDGRVGNRTIEAIKKFQSFWFPAYPADGRVDVAKRSHRQLEAGTHQVLFDEEIVTGDPRKARARLLVQQFAAKQTPGVFRHLSRQQIAQELLLRIDQPSLINQGQAGLCPSASVAYTLALSRPDEYVKAVTELYDTGRTRIDRWSIEPDSDLKDYQLPAAAHIPAADWVITASIRDSENWFIDYQATTDQGGAWGNEVARWLRLAGYRTVIEEWNYTFTKDEDHLRRASTLYNRGHHVCLLLHAEILRGQTGWTLTPNHWVVLASSMQFGQHNRRRTVSMSVFTWGTRRQIPQSAQTPVYLSDFLDHYYGFVASKL